MRHDRGFTLLELMIVLGIFAVLAVMAYGGLNSVLTSRAHIARSLERTGALQKAYLRLRDDLQQLRARPVRDGYGEPQAALVALHDGRVEFTRGGWRNPLSLPRSTLQRVTYRVDDQQRLVREAWPVLDRAQDSEPTPTVLLDRVEEARWRFLDASLQWQDRWPPTTIAGSAGVEPPRAVELTLGTADLGELRLLFSASNKAPPAAGVPPPGGGSPP